MFPKRAALFVGLLGLGSGVLQAVVTWHQNSVLACLLSGLIGSVLGGGILVWWQRAESRGKGFSPGWFLFPPCAIAFALALDLAASVPFAIGGYGLGLWVGIQIWERHRNKPISWRDFNPKPKE